MNTPGSKHTYIPSITFLQVNKCKKNKNKKLNALPNVHWDLLCHYSPFSRFSIGHFYASLKLHNTYTHTFTGHCPTVICQFTHEQKLKCFYRILTSFLSSCSFFMPFVLLVQMMKPECNLLLPSTQEKYNVIVCLCLYVKPQTKCHALQMRR